MTEPANVDEVDVDVDAAALASFLDTRPPTSLLALSDRLLIASVVPRAEAAGFAARFLPDVLAHARGDDAAAQLTTLCVLCATLEDLGVDVHDLRFALALVARVIAPPAREPFRSTQRYWLWRASLARSFDVDRPAPSLSAAGPLPSGERWLDFAYFSHRVLFASAYGKTPIDVDVARAAGFDDAVATVDLDDGDAVALLLLCAMGIAPRPEVGHLWRRLAELQQDDGAFITRVDGDIARHHAACVAWLALALR